MAGSLGVRSFGVLSEGSQGPALEFLGVYDGVRGLGVRSLGFRGFRVLGFRV